MVTTNERVIYTTEYQHGWTEIPSGQQFIAAEIESRRCYYHDGSTLLLMVPAPLSSVDAPETQAVFDALEDSDCRRIIEELENPQTAKELSDDCDLPLSTTYRKLDILTEASLLSERTVIQSDGHHTTQYEVAFEEVSIVLDEDHNITIGIHREPDSTDERLESLWAEVRRET